MKIGDVERQQQGGDLTDHETPIPCRVVFLFGHRHVSDYVFKMRFLSFVFDSCFLLFVLFVVVFSFLCPIASRI